MAQQRDLDAEREQPRFRLLEFRIAGLFEEHDYSIPLRQNDNVTAIIAPNGAGKTICLRMINDLFQGDLSIFIETQYERADFRFNDNSMIIIRKIDNHIDEEEQRPVKSFSLNVIDSEGRLTEEWKPQNPRFALERYLPFMRKIGPGRWRNADTGESFSQHEIMANYGEVLPLNIKRRFLGKLPDSFLAITKRIDCHLIETQRLLILREEEHYGPGGRYMNVGVSQKPKLAIAKKAEALKATISRAINDYASLSQTLDRSFPRRVIERGNALPALNFETQLAGLDKRRNELMSVGILDTEANEPTLTLPPRDLSPELVTMLSVYAEDTGKKLESLAPLLARTKLFKKLIDERFGNKDVRISRDNGIDIFSRGEPLPLDKLSSGEQHQLVLFFELLFEIGSSSLILIDEPELSLHVAWQKKFIGDLMQIISLNNFDVVLATHSPQLVGRWTNLVVELGDVFEGEIDESDDSFGIESWGSN